jgi:ribosome-associated protein
VSAARSSLAERRTTIVTKSLFPKISLPQLERIITTALDTNKAEKIVSVDLKGKADFADRMVIASGTSTRHVGALAEYVVTALKQAGYESVLVEGKESCEWVLVDAGDVVVHIFKPDMREHYNLEKMWALPHGVAEVAL